MAFLLAEFIESIWVAAMIPANRARTQKCGSDRIPFVGKGISWIGWRVLSITLSQLRFIKALTKSYACLGKISQGCRSYMRGDDRDDDFWMRRASPDLKDARMLFKVTETGWDKAA